MPNDGTATLIIPNRKLADDFLRWAFRKGNHVKVSGKKVWLRASDKRPSRAMVESLKKTPYMDPTAEEERVALVGRIGKIGIILDAIQFGVYYRRPDDPPEANRRFSNEYEIRRTDTFAGKLCFDYNHKLLRIEVSRSRDCLDIRIEMGTYRWATVSLNTSLPTSSPTPTISRRSRTGSMPQGRTVSSLFTQ